MNQLSEKLNEYLILRRGLGFKLKDHEIVLRKFINFLQAHDSDFVTTRLALEWAQQPSLTSAAYRAQRLGRVRAFAQYLSVKDPRTEIPPADLLPGRTRRTQPYIYSAAQIMSLFQASSLLGPRNSLRPHTYGSLFGLLAVTGMRVGEVIALRDPDVDLRQGLITVRQGKFNKTRILPVHETTQMKLCTYVQYRDELAPIRATDHFFVSSRGVKLNNSIVQHAFIQISVHIGLRALDDHLGPRIHDLRHTFAVRTLIDWHRMGIDPEQRLPLLSAYLGHTKVSDTYWYLSAIPELMDAVNTRLEHYLGDQS